MATRLWESEEMGLARQMVMGKAKQGGGHKRHQHLGKRAERLAECEGTEDSRGTMLNSA